MSDQPALYRPRHAVVLAHPDPHSFNSLVAEKAPLLALAASDPEAAKAAARAEVDRYNPSGSPLSTTGMAAFGPYGRLTSGDGRGGAGLPARRRGAARVARDLTSCPLR